MATRIDGKALAAKVKGRVAAAVKTLPRRPGLAVVLVGDDPASQVYVRGKEADCAECGKPLVQRKDDTPETIQNRLNVYAHQTAPLIDYYQKQGLLRTVDCSGTIEQNHRAVRKALGIA